jgi:hypothetical protein
LKPQTNRWSESFAIFEKYGLGDYDVNGYHDVIMVGLNQPLTTSEDGKRLLELGWFKEEYEEDEETGKVISYNEEFDWQHYT